MTRRLLQDEDLLHEVRPEDRDGSNLYRPEMYHFYDRLPELKPSVLYVFGGRSEASPPANRADKMARTGTGAGGSGGAKEGRVQEVVLDCGHLVGMEKPDECADACVDFMVDELDRWEDKERRWDENEIYFLPRMIHVTRLTSHPQGIVSRALKRPFWPDWEHTHGATVVIPPPINNINAFCETVDKL